MCRHDELTPDGRRELDAVDRALAAQPVEADLRELEDLVHDVRATAPAMSRSSQSAASARSLRVLEVVV